MKPTAQPLPTERPGEGFLRSRISNHNHITGLATAGDLEAELWSCLEYYSEIEEVLDNFLRTKGYTHATNRRKARNDFVAYIRQAKSNYYAAKALPARSSGLLYYYSFLNLVKAGLIAHDSSLLGKKFVHGQRPKGEKLKKFSDHYQRVESSRSTTKVYVLPKFYELYYGTAIKNQDLNVLRLLGYCSDVGFQYSEATKSRNRLFPSYFAIKINRSTAKSWPLLAIFDFQTLEPYKKTFQQFMSNFEEVDVKNLAYNQVFGITASPAIERYRFFQGRTEHDLLSDGRVPYNPSICALTDTLKAHIQDNYYPNGFDFYITEPYSSNNQIAINEMIAIYVVMHHISELVRYNPSFMESLLSSKEAWLLEGFIQSSPSTFLRGIIAWITGTSYLMEIR